MNTKQSTDDFLDGLFADAEARNLEKKTKRIKKKQERAEYLQLLRPKTIPVNLKNKEEWINVAYVRTVTYQECAVCGHCTSYTHPQLMLLTEHIEGTSQVFKPIEYETVELPHRPFEINEVVKECVICFMSKQEAQDEESS